MKKSNYINFDASGTATISKNDFYSDPEVKKTLSKIRIIVKEFPEIGKEGVHRKYGSKSKFSKETK